MRKFGKFIYFASAVWLMLSASIWLFAPKVNADSQFQYIWPTSEIAADPNADSQLQWISANGRYVAMFTKESNGNNLQSWLIDRSTGQSQLINGYVHQFSDDTRYMFYAKSQVATDGSGTFITYWLQDRTTGDEVQLGSDQSNANFDAGIVGPNAGQRAISNDGSVVEFIATHFNTIVPGTSNNTAHLYSYDINTQQYTLIDDPSDGQVISSTISGNGRYILYAQGNTFDTYSIYLYDKITGSRQLIGTPLDCRGDSVRINDDGTVVAYSCRSGSDVVNLNTGERRDIYDQGTAMTSMSNDGQYFTGTGGNGSQYFAYSWQNNEALPIDDANVGEPLISGDGTYIAGLINRPANPPDVPYATAAPVFGPTPNFIPPSIPTNLTAPNPTSSNPVLSWGSVSGADSYNIYRNGTKIDGVNAPSATYTDMTAGGAGTYDYYVTAVNTAGESSPSNTITVTVGTTPAITSANGAITGMRVPFSFTVTTSGNPTPGLTENGALPSGITFTDNADGTATISGEAAAGSSGTYPITINASNGISPDAAQTFTLTVNSSTSAPAITSDNNDTETFSVPFSYTVTTDGYPAPALTKTGSLPSGVTFTDNGDGTATIAGTPAQAAIGSYNLTLKAKSSIGTVTQAFTFTITKAPVLHAIVNKTTGVGTPFSMTITAKGYTTPELDLTGGSLPAGLNFTDNGDGTATISGTALQGSGGAYPLTVTASNQLGTSSQTFTLKVNEAPAFTSANVATAHTNSGFSFQVTASGYPKPHLSKLGALPHGLTWHGSTGIISGTPAANSAGSYPITFTAKNSQGTVTHSFVLVVTQGGGGQ